MNSRKGQSNNIERRYATHGVELRKSDTGEHEVFGYALKFGVRYDMGWFTEEVHRDALQGADLDDVRILRNHDSNILLGRTKSGTAQVGVDDTGLWYKVSLPDSPDGQNMRASIERGDTDQSSWGFELLYNDEVNGDEWTRENGKDHRVLRHVSKVWDASPVTFPANPDTSVAKRSRDAIEKEQQEQNQKRINHKKVAEIDCILAEARI